MPEPCFCGKAKPYAQCCGVFIEGGKAPKTPEQLMRSRYSAYAQGGQGQYLFDTWYPATRSQLSPAQLDKHDSDWQRLVIHDRGQQGDEGFVAFTAYFIDRQGEAQALTEKSVFQRVSGRWFYVGGEVSVQPQSGE